jgi:hypothetical protein
MLDDSATAAHIVKPRHSNIFYHINAINYYTRADKIVRKWTRWTRNFHLNLNKKTHFSSSVTALSHTPSLYEDIFSREMVTTVQALGVEVGSWYMKWKWNKMSTFILRTYPSKECSRRWGYTSKCIEAVPAEDSNLLGSLACQHSALTTRLYTHPDTCTNLSTQTSPQPSTDACESDGPKLVGWLKFHRRLPLMPLQNRKESQVWLENGYYHLYLPRHS